MSQSSLLREPWKSFARQREAGTLGIWAFLASEVLFFGALLLTYAAGRYGHVAGFAAAARETNIWFGTINTAVLLTSSFTMAMASQAAEGGHHRALVRRCLWMTAALGIAFLVVKGFEYREDIEKHLVPGHDFALPQDGAVLFFALYWLITGVHAVHLSIGIVMVLRLAILGHAKGIELTDNPEVEVTALYWHLVDIIWIFLYPLLYLPGRAS